MQHGTAREVVRDTLENIERVLRYEVDANGRPYRDLVKATVVALAAIDDPDFDERGKYSPIGTVLRRI